MRSTWCTLKPQFHLLQVPSEFLFQLAMVSKVSPLATGKRIPWGWAYLPD